MTLNDLEHRTSPLFCVFSPNSTDFHTDYITLVEDTPITSVKYCLPQSFTFGQFMPMNVSQLCR